MSDERERNRPPVAAWVGFWVGFAALDYWADRRGASLSCATRRLFHTHHPIGRGIVTVGLAVGAVALERHINKH